MADIGHNNPPDDYEAKAQQELIPEFKRVYELAAAASRACGAIGGKITDQEQANKLGDFIKQLRAAKKAVTDRRMKITRPLEEQKKASIAEHKPFEELTNAVSTNLTQLYLVPWQVQEERRINAEREAAQKAKEEAERKRREAEEEAERIKQTAVDGDDVAASIEASIAADKAKEEAKAAKKALSESKKQTAGAGSAGAGRRVGLRTSYETEITDYDKFYSVYGTHQWIKEAMDRVAQDLARNKDTRESLIKHAEQQGVKVTEEKRAA